MSFAEDLDSFRRTILETSSLRKFDRARDAVEDATYEAGEADIELRKAERRLRRIVARIGREQREPTRPLTDPLVTPPTVRPPVDPPPVGPPVIIDPPPYGGSRMVGAPQRVEPIKPTAIDAMVFEDGTFALVYGHDMGPRHPGMARDAYAAVEATLSTPRKIALAIHGNVGRVSLGYAYSPYSDDLFKTDKGWPIDVTFVGGNASAAVGPIFVGSNAGDLTKFDICRSASFFDIGINGSPDPYAFRQHDYIEELIFDRVWIVPNAGYVAQAGMHRSAFLLNGDWEHMTLKRYEPRGMRMEEHVAYIQGGGFTQVLDCNLFGGRRTGYQDRSHQDSQYPSPTRHGDFIADGNYAEGFGFNHSEASGGQWLTNWFSGEYKVRISNNRCTDARYGCLGIAKGTPSSEPYLTEDGLSHSNVYIWGNEFENKRAQRSCVSIADARMVHFGEGNRFAGPEHGAHTMVLGSQWGWKNAAAVVPKDWAWYGVEAMPLWPVVQYLPGTDSFQLLSYEDHRAHLVAGGGR